MKPSGTLMIKQLEPISSSIHKTPVSAQRLAPVVFESVHLEYVDCTYCEDQCFRDVTLSYKAQSSNPTGKSVRRTVSALLWSVENSRIFQLLSLFFRCGNANGAGWRARRRTR